LIDLTSPVFISCVYNVAVIPPNHPFKRVILYQSILIRINLY